MKKFFSSKIILNILAIMPIIDIITSIMTRHNISMTIGIVLKLLILLFSTIYLLFYDKNKKINYIIILILGLFTICNIINNIDVLKIGFISYFSYLFKYIYFIIMSLYFIKFLKNNEYKIEQLKCPITIIVIMIILSNITGTAFNSYGGGVRLGNCGWYSSANEFGSLLTLFYPIAIFIFLDKKNARIIDIFYILVLAYALLNLGTKVGIIALISTNVFYLVYRLFTIKKYKLNKTFFVILVMLLTTLSIYNVLPVSHNMKINYSEAVSRETINNKKNNNKSKKNNIILKLVFSGRNEYIEEALNFDRDSFDYLIGKYYIVNNDIYITESDIVDIILMEGIAGFLILFIPLIYIAITIIKKYFKNFKDSFSYTKINLILLSIALTFAISILVGHTITAPAVSIYLALIIGYLYNYTEFKKSLNNNKNVLLLTNEFNKEKIENIIKYINKDKYHIDIFIINVSKDDKNTYEHLSIIRPYGKFVEYLLIKKSKFSQIIIKILFNNYTSFLYKNEKEYDYCILLDDNKFLISYAKNSNCKKKLTLLKNKIKNIDNVKKYELMNLLN